MKNDKKSAPSQPPKEHHEIEDPVPKLLHIFVNHGIGGLKSPAHRVYGAILESWNLELVNRQKRFCSVGWDVLCLRAKMDRKALKRWVRKLADVGLVNLQYIIHRKPLRDEGYDNIPLIFSKYDDASAKLEELRKEGRDGSRNVGPYITSPKKLPSPESYGLHLANNKDRYYMRRIEGQNVPGTGVNMAHKGGPNGPLLGASVLGGGGPSASLNGSNLNEPDLNDSNLKENNSKGTEGMSFITTNGEVVEPTSSHLKIINSLPPDIQQVATEFMAEHVRRFGNLPTCEELRPISDSETQNSVRGHMTDLLAAGGELDEWMQVEHDRLLKHKNKKGSDFNPPRIEFLGNSASFSKYMAVLKKRLLESQTPLLVKELEDREVIDLLNISPDADRAFVRSLSVIKTYREADDRRDYKSIRRLIGLDRIDSLKLRRNIFAYAALKYQVHADALPEWVYASAMKFADEMFDELLEESLLPKQMAEAADYIKCNYQEQ
ncbi:MAG: hypothetical protein K2Q26_02715 [Bdellovibrionales bacterium]|nr:hypothetical protein [Bdellovibrionales bacterium]